jgi:hypothetical protein
MAEFALEPHPEKTRLIEFGRWAGRDRAARGDGKPETFDFPGDPAREGGFTHICARSRRGGFLLTVVRGFPGGQPSLACSLAHKHARSLGVPSSCC